MWFIILLVVTPHAMQPLSDRMAGFRFKSHDACMADAWKRVSGLRAVGYHGRYLCMYHNESESALAATPKADF